MRRILLLGPRGQLGWELQRSLAPLGTVIPAARPAADLADMERLRVFVREQAPHIVVNAAAYTAVDQAEGEPEKALLVNGTAVRVLADEAAKAGALLLHYSTDYVFDGTKAGAYTEDDAPNPLSVYGRTKLAGERAVRSSGCNHLLFRTSWVYGAHGGNFAKTILRLAREREELAVVADQVGAPTSAALLADVSAACIALVMDSPARQPWGLYHVVASGCTSWHAYARYIVETAEECGMHLKLSTQALRAVSSAEYGVRAPRPLNSRLSTGKLKAVFGLNLPDWKAHVRELVAQLCALEAR